MDCGIMSLSLADHKHFFSKTEDPNSHPIEGSLASTSGSGDLRFVIR